MCSWLRQAWIFSLALVACAGQQQAAREGGPRDPALDAAEGRRYLFGEGVTRDRARALAGFEAGCAGGDREACVILAVTFEKDLPRSLIEQCIAANQVSCLVFRESPPSYDLSTEVGTAQVKSDCDRGFPYACARLVIMGPRDRAERALLEKACTLGDPDACTAIATPTEQAGTYVQTDEDKAWHSKAVLSRADYCAKGSAPDCMALGWWYQAGLWGLDKDRAKSEEYRRRGLDLYLPLCRRGHLPACVAVARSSLVPAEKTEAAKIACFMDASWCQ